MDCFTIPTRDLFGSVPDRSPQHIPPTEARSALGTASLQLRFMAVGHPRGLEIAALADVLDALNEGETEAACEACQAVQAARRAKREAGL